MWPHDSRLASMVLSRTSAIDFTCNSFSRVLHLLFSFSFRPSTMRNGRGPESMLGCKAEKDITQFYIDSIESL